MSNPFNYAMNENPFVREERIANFERKQRNRNTHREKLRNLRQKASNARHREQTARYNTRRRDRLARLNGKSPTNNNTNTANLNKARQEANQAHAEYHNYMFTTMKHGIEEEQTLADNIPKVVKKANESFAASNEFLRQIAENQKKRDRNEMNRLRYLPKNEALHSINQRINMIRNVYEKQIAQLRNTVAQTRKYSEKQYNAEAEGVLSAFNPNMNLTSPEGKAMNQVIQNRLKNIKNTRKAARQLYNNQNKNIENSIKHLSKTSKNTIQRLQALRNEISRKKK